MIEALKDIPRSRTAEPKLFKPSALPQARAKISSRPKRSAGVVGFVVLAAISAVGLTAYGYWPTKPPTSVVATDPSVVGLGFLEPSSIVVRIAAPGNSNSSRIAELKVEGDEVESGQILAVLDTAEKSAAQVASSRTQIALKHIMLERQQLDTINTIDSRRSDLERARADLDLKSAENERQKTLFVTKARSLTNADKPKKDYLAAAATVREAESALRRIAAMVNVRTGTKPGLLIEVAVPAQELAAAEADLTVAQASLEQSYTRAPFKGCILSFKARAGERISADGLLEIGATDRMRAVVEVYQTDIGRILLG